MARNVLRCLDLIWAMLTAHAPPFGAALAAANGQASAARSFWRVGCMPLILMEALSSAYRRGMLALGKQPKERRRPHAILHETTQILLWP
jgi:hypothetical protein